MPNQPKTPVRCHRIPDDEYLPAVLIAAKTGETMTALVRRALRNLVSTAVLVGMLFVGGMAGHREGQITLFGGGVCKSVATCERNADIGTAVAAMIAEQVATYGPTCVDPAAFVGIPSRVLVRNARLIDGDTGVVRAITLDQALAAAKAGDVYVLKACA